MSDNEERTPGSVLAASTENAVYWFEGDSAEAAALVVDVEWFTRLWDQLTFNAVTMRSKPVPATQSHPGTRIQTAPGDDRWKPYAEETTPPYEPPTLGPWFCECQPRVQVAGWVDVCPNCGVPGPQHGRLQLGRDMHSMDCVRGDHEHCLKKRGPMGSLPCACACHAINDHNRQHVPF